MYHVQHFLRPCGHPVVAKQQKLCDTQNPTDIKAKHIVTAVSCASLQTQLKQTVLLTTPSSQAQLSLTFDSDLRHSLNDAEAAHGHAGVVG